jgi:hypothetical protein
MVAYIRRRLNMRSSSGSTCLTPRVDTVELFQRGGRSLVDKWRHLLAHIWNISPANGPVVDHGSSVNSQDRVGNLRHLAPSLVVLCDCISVLFSSARWNLRSCITSSMSRNMFVRLWLRGCICAVRGPIARASRRRSESGEEGHDQW